MQQQRRRYCFRRGAAARDQRTRRPASPASVAVRASRSRSDPSRKARNARTSSYRRSGSRARHRPATASQPATSEQARRARKQHCPSTHADSSSGLLAALSVAPIGSPDTAAPQRSHASRLRDHCCPFGAGPATRPWLLLRLVADPKQKLGAGAQHRREWLAVRGNEGVQHRRAAPALGDEEGRCCGETGHGLPP
jgi:hypothetical protein